METTAEYCRIRVFSFDQKTRVDVQILLENCRLFHSFFFFFFFFLLCHRARVFRNKSETRFDLGAQGRKAWKFRERVVGDFEILKLRGWVTTPRVSNGTLTTWKSWNSILGGSGGLQTLLLMTPRVAKLDTDHCRTSSITSCRAPAEKWLSYYNFTLVPFTIFDPSVYLYLPPYINSFFTSYLCAILIFNTSQV